MLLRPRQQVFVDKAACALNQEKNTLGIAPTGAGKTVMLSAIADRMLEGSGRKALILQHRVELLYQNKNTFEAYNGSKYSTSIVNANERNFEGQAIFAMIQTLVGWYKMLPKIDLLIVDEAHHIVADTYLFIIKHLRKLNPDLMILGVTATPQRGDEMGLARVFTNVCDVITIKELIASGHLVKPKSYVISLGLEDKLKKVKKNDDGEYNQNQVAQLLNTEVIHQEVFRHWEEKAGDRQGVIFCGNVKHSKEISSVYQTNGISCSHIDGSMSPKLRADILSEYDKGNIQVLSNVNVLTEGWDHQPTSCIVLLKQSTFISTLQQIIGRGLRVVDFARYPEAVKSDCVVLDFGISLQTHGTLEASTDLGDPNSEGIQVCPQCKVRQPKRLTICSVCGFVFKKPQQKKEEDLKALDTTTKLETVELEEFHLFEKSVFFWSDLSENEQKMLMATGFGSWGLVIWQDNINAYVAIVGAKDTPATIITKGDRLNCMSKCDDFMNSKETNNNAKKAAKWLHEPPTHKQLQYLPPKMRQDFGLTRYRASLLITLKFNERAIKKVLKEMK